jgi:hypothetical protein
MLWTVFGIFQKHNIQKHLKLKKGRKLEIQNASFWQFSSFHHSNRLTKKVFIHYQASHIIQS